jgi:hypothetical protein
MAASLRPWRVCCSFMRVRREPVSRSPRKPGFCSLAIQTPSARPTPRSSPPSGPRQSAGPSGTGPADGALRPIPEQRLDHLEDHSGRWEHGDHNTGAAHDVARSFGRLATTTLESTNVIRLAVPRDHRDPPIDKPMGHRGTHQADAQQPDANLLLTGLGVHSPPAIIPQTRRSGALDRPERLLAAAIIGR